jgi:hypothetical protein
MEVEKSLNRGTEKSNVFSHLVHSHQKCKKSLYGSYSVRFNCNGEKITFAHLLKE